MPYKQPPKEHQIKKGQILNPTGRPKGFISRSTVARYVLSMKGTPPDKILTNLKAMYPKFFEKKSQRWGNELLATIRICQKAIITGDVPAYLAVMDSAYGKPTEPIDLTSGGEQLKGINILKIDLSKLSYEELRGLITEAYSANRDNQDQPTPKSNDIVSVPAR